jgi:outer membrane biosynthesis protein TonB
MRAIFISWVVVVALSCVSCATAPQPKASVPAVPPPAPPPPPAAIIEAQTVAQLPAPQPVPPESMPPRPAIEYHPPTPEVEQEQVAPAPTVTKTSKNPKRPAAPPATEPAPAEAPPAAVEETTAPATLNAADDNAISKAQVNGTLGEVQQLLKEITARPPSAATRAAVTRINSFVRLSEQSINRNDLRQADVLAQRALALAKDLARPR